MTQKWINNNPFPNSLWIGRGRKLYYSSASVSSLIWVIGGIVIVIISCYCENAQAFHSPVHLRRKLEAEAQPYNRIEPEIDGEGADLADPEISDTGNGGFGNGKYENYVPGLPGHAARSLNDIAAREDDNEGDAYVREPRAADYRRVDDDDIGNSRRHYNRIPTSRLQMQDGFALARRGTSPPPDEDDEDDFESLEANREAFEEILDDHAKHPHRRRSFKRHNTKMHLKYDFENQRYSITEDQSDEW